MRAITTTTISILALGLLAGSAVGVAAQGDDASVPAWVTGTVELGINDLRGEETANGPAVMVEGIGFRNNGWDASDPRLSGAATYTGTWLGYREVERMQVQAGSYVLVNDDGRWVGTSTALVGPGIDSDAITLTGEGAYDGLTAYVVMDFTADPVSFNAAIFPAEMPTSPEPRQAD